MIRYQNVLGSQIYNEVMLRLGDMRSGTNVDEGTIFKAINRALTEIWILTKPYKDWAYYKKVEITTNPYELPVDYYKYVRLLCNTDHGLRECRYADPKEIYSLTDDNQSQIWNKSSNTNPIFTVFGAMDTFVSTYMPTTNWLHLYIDNFVDAAYLDYIAVPYLLNLDQTIPIPYEYQQYVIQASLLRILNLVADPGSYQHIIQDLQFKKSIIINSLKAEQYTEKRELDNFVEPVVPYIPAQPIEGELQKQL